MPDSRPRPPLLAWDGIVIANADFAAMVAAAVNATSAERREADSLSAAATVALRRARRARTGAACSTHTHDTVSINPSRARQSPHTRHPSSHPSSSTFHRVSFVPIHSPIHPSIHHRSSPSIRACVPRPIISRVFAYVPREGQWCERSSRTSSSSSSSCVARARGRARPHASTGAPRSRISTLEVSIHESRLIDVSPHTRRAIIRSRSRDDHGEGAREGLGFVCVSYMDDVRTRVWTCHDAWTDSLVRSRGCGKTIFYPFFVQDDTSRVERGFGRGVKSRAGGWMDGWMDGMNE